MGTNHKSLRRWRHSLLAKDKLEQAKMQSLQSRRATQQWRQRLTKAKHARHARGIEIRAKHDVSVSVPCACPFLVDRRPVWLPSFALAQGRWCFEWSARERVCDRQPGSTRGLAMAGFTASQPQHLTRTIRCQFTHTSSPPTE